MAARDLVNTDACSLPPDETPGSLHEGEDHRRATLDLSLIVDPCLDFRGPKVPKYYYAPIQEADSKPSPRSMKRAQSHIRWLHGLQAYSDT